MELILCYKNLQIGKLTFNGKMYGYQSLPDLAEFNKQYGYIDFPLIAIDKQKFKQIPHFFGKFVDVLINNVAMATKLNINLQVDTYFDILCRYATLPQTKNTFHYMVK